MTLELTSLIPLVGSLAENPLAVKHFDNRLYMHTLPEDIFSKGLLLLVGSNARTGINEYEHKN